MAQPTSQAKKVGGPTPTTTAKAPAAAPAATAPKAPAAAPAAAPTTAPAKVVGGAAPAPAPAPAPAAATETVKKGGPIGVQRVDFDLTTAVNDKGESVAKTDGEGDDAATVLTGVPANWNMNKHKPLTKENFDGEVNFLLFKASVADQWAKRYLESAAKYREAAERSAKYGDEDTRKKAAKLDKMRREYLALQAELAAEGIESKPLTEEATETASAE